MWIRSLEVFQVMGAEPETWQEAFSAYPLKDPVASQRQSFGFVAQPDSDIIVDELDGQYAFLTVVATRHLPSDAVDREVRKRIESIKGGGAKDSVDGGQGGDPVESTGDAFQKEVYDQVLDDMLAKAPIRETRTPAVYCSRSQLLYVFASNRQGVEALQMAMREALGSFTGTPVRPRERVSTLMGNWVRGVDVPEHLKLGDSMILSVGDDGASIAFKKQDLQSEEVIQHLDAGAQVKRLALTWNGQLEFELDDKGQLMRIGPPGCKMKAQLAFVHWPEIMSLLPKFTNEMFAIMGAELAESEDDQVDQATVHEQLDDALGSLVEKACRSSTDPESSRADTRAHDPQDGDERSGDGASFVPVVMPRPDARAGEVERMLETLDSRRPMTGVIVVQRPVDAYRAVYAWANSRGLPITLMPLPNEKTGRPARLPGQATAAVHVDEDQLTGSILEMARERGVQIIRMVQPEH